MAEIAEDFVERWREATASDKPPLMIEFCLSLAEKPVAGWRTFHALRETLNTGDVDAACCTRIAQSLQPALEELAQNSVVENGTLDKSVNEVLEGMIFFVTEFMTSVCLSEGPSLAYNALTHLYESTQRSAVHVELVSALQNCLVDYHVAVPENSAPSASNRQVKFWLDGISYALEVSRFDPASRQVSTLCRSIGDAFFGGGKLASVIKKLNDMTGKIEEARTDPAYRFDHEAAKLVQRFSKERGPLTGYSCLWALLEGFLLRVCDDKDYLSSLMLLVHFLQAVGAPIKCMPAPSILEYPQAELDETERLFHVVKLLEIYIASGMYHPSVLVSSKKRFRGPLIFTDMLVFVLKHPAKGSVDWYHALLSLSTIASTVAVGKLRMILQNAWFDCTPEDITAQNDFLIFLIETYDKMHKAADFYTRFLGAINEYLDKHVPEPELTKPVLVRMRASFASLGIDDAIKIWTDYVRYLLQILQKWKDSDASLNKYSQIFVLKVFAEFMQHCPLVPLMEANSEQRAKMDEAIGDTLKLTALLRDIMSGLPKTFKDILPHYVRVMQKYIKCHFVRRYYLDCDVASNLDYSANLQQELVTLVEENFKMLKKDRMLRLDVLCTSVKLTEHPKARANQCLEEICANFHTIDWQLLLAHHPQVVECASKKHVEEFVNLLFIYLKKHRTCPYIESQQFRGDSRQVVMFVKLIVRNLAEVVAQTHAKLIEALDIENLTGPVKWKNILSLIIKDQKTVDLSDIATQSRALLTLVPVFALPPTLRVKLFALMMSVTLSHSVVSEGFFDDACYHLEDLSSALKFKGICEDTDLALVCKLATLCLDRILAFNSTLRTQQSSMRRVLDLIHFIQFTAVKQMTSVNSIRAILDQFSLQSDADFCAVLLLVETLNQVHHKGISPEELAEFRLTCKTRVNKALVKGSFKLQNMVYIASKYAEVFGMTDALAVQSVKLAFQSAAETVLALRPDGAAMKLCALALRDGDTELNEAIPVRTVVFCCLLAGGENEQVVIKTMNAGLAHKLWPLVSSVMDDLQEISSFVEIVASDSGMAYVRSPFRLHGSDLSPVTGDDIFNRCLVLLPAIVKHCDETVLLAIIKKVSSVVTNRATLSVGSLRVDLCAAVLDAAARRRPASEVLISIYATLARLPLENMEEQNSDVDEWSTTLGIIADLVGRGLVAKVHYTSGVAQLLLGLLSRLIAAAVRGADRRTFLDDDNNSNSQQKVAGVVHVIDRIHRVLFIMHRLRRQDPLRHSRMLDTCGSFLIASYLHAAVMVSLHPRLRSDVHAMAFMILGLCNSKGLFALKLESDHGVQEALRKLVEEYKAKFQVRKL